MRRMVVQQLRLEVDKEREARELIAAQCLEEKGRRMEGQDVARQLRDQVERCSLCTPCTPCTPAQ